MAQGHSTGRQSGSQVPGLGTQPGYFPNDSFMRGLDRKLRRQLPPSDGNPRQVPGEFTQVGAGVTPEGLHPSGVLDAPSGKFGLGHNSGTGP
jgi:hypothetical protein